jgi:hypothetical protein
MVIMGSVRAPRAAAAPNWGVHTQIHGGDGFHGGEGGGHGEGGLVSA